MEAFPTGVRKIHQAVRRGFYRPLYSKRIVFAPGFIDEINYSPGCHQASPTGTVVEDRSCQLKVLHAGSVGRQRILTRRQAVKARQSAFNRANGFSRHIEVSPDQLERQFDEYRRVAGHLWFLGLGGASIADYVQLAKRRTKRLLGFEAIEPGI